MVRNELKRIENGRFKKLSDDNSSMALQTVEIIDWDIHSLISLIITSHHFDLRQQVLKIYSLANDVFVKRNNEYPELAKLVESLFFFFDDLLFQFKKEEQIVTSGIINDFAPEMINGHRNVFAQLQFLRTLTNDYKTSEDMCHMHKRLYTDMKKFEQELSSHIYMERDILIPAAIQMKKIL